MQNNSHKSLTLHKQPFYQHYLYSQAYINFEKAGCWVVSSRPSWWYQNQLFKYPQRHLSLLSWPFVCKHNSITFSNLLKYLTLENLFHFAIFFYLNYRYCDCKFKVRYKMRYTIHILERAPWHLFANPTYLK